MFHLVRAHTHIYISRERERERVCFHNYRIQSMNQEDLQFQKGIQDSKTVRCYDVQ